MLQISGLVRRAAFVSALAAAAIASSALPAAAHHRNAWYYRDCCNWVCCDCYTVCCDYDDGEYYPPREHHRHLVGYTEGYGLGYPYYGDNPYPDRYYRHHEWRERDGD